jgi:hypothetical protein
MPNADGQLDHTDPPALFVCLALACFGAAQVIAAPNGHHVSTYMPFAGTSLCSLLCLLCA